LRTAAAAKAAAVTAAVTAAAIAVPLMESLAPPGLRQIHYPLIGP